MGVAICDEHAQETGRTALLTESPDGKTARHTFAELKRHSDRFALALRSLGVGKGDRVGIVLPQRVETAIAHIAIYKLGAVALPLSVLFGQDALHFRLKDSGARVVIADGRRDSVLQSIRQDLPDLQTVVTCNDGDPATEFWSLVEGASGDFQPVRTRSDDPAFLIYTSGTTGPPKGALSAHRSLLGHLPGFELSPRFSSPRTRT